MKIKSLLLPAIAFLLLCAAFEPMAPSAGMTQPPIIYDTLWVGHGPWGPQYSDPARACDQYSQELLFNCYDRLLAMGGKVTYGSSSWASHEQYWDFEPSLSTNVPNRVDVFMTVADNGIDPENPEGYWFEVDGKYYRIERWDCGDFDSQRTGIPSTESNSQLSGLSSSNELIVGFEELTEAALDSIRKSGGCPTREIPALDAAIVRVEEGLESRFAESIGSSPGFEYLEPNDGVGAEYVPNDPDWSLQWNLRKIQADRAWDTNPGSPSVVIAIIDSGIDYNHPDLSANYIIGGYDWVNSDPFPLDDYGHGTHCAGIVAAITNNAIGVAGVSQCGVLAEKVLGNDGKGTLANLASAIVHATDFGVDIISMSLGWYEKDLIEDPPVGNWTGDSTLVRDACQYAWDSGVLLLASAGNDNVNIDICRHYPASYDTVVAVSATDSNDLKAIYSNYGYEIEVAAPGSDVYSTLPSSSYGYKSGTSMACPHAAGVAGLALSQFPTLTNIQLRKQLHRSVDDLGLPGKDDRFGYGRINASKAVTITPSLGGGDTLYIGEYTEWQNLETLVGVRAWRLIQYVPGVKLSLQRWYFDFNLRTEANENPIYFFYETGEVADTFNAYDAEYSFERALVQDQKNSLVGRFYELFFDQMDSDYWNTDNPADARMLAFMIDDAIERPSENILRLNICFDISDIGFKQIICSTVSSIVSKEFSISIGCWDGDLHRDFDYNGYPDWWDGYTYSVKPRRTNRSAYDMIFHLRWVGTGPYRVWSFDQPHLRVIFQRDEMHWRGWPSLQRKAFLSTIELHFIAARAVRTTAFNDSDIDICDNPNTATGLLDALGQPVDPKNKLIQIDKLTGLTKWLKCWVKGWYYNPYYPSDYYYHLYKEDMCWGDITGPTSGVPDGICNMRDVSLLITRFGGKAPDSSGSYPPVYDLKWAPGTYGLIGGDLYGDRRIDMRDIVFAIIHFNHGSVP